MKEWKRIKGFEHYQISNEGEVRNEDGKILKPFKTSSGYLQVHLFKDKKRTKKYIHRLVAESFVPNIRKLNEVNHLNGDKTDNCSWNLEWCTRKENLIHSCYTLKNHVKPVKCIETGLVYRSIKEAARATGIHHTSISMCCDGRQKKTHGTHWEFVKEGGIA